MYASLSLRLFAGILVLFGTAQSFAESPDEILASFEIDPAFQIEFLAMEPLVLDPVDLRFDELGRIFVLEMPGYPLGEVPGQIVLLKDEDADGRPDKRKIFAEGFPVAVSILPWQGGLLVASPPDLIFVKDTDGDDAADIRETVLTGFELGNTQHNFNGLTYGLDNWIYLAGGGNAGQVHWPDKAEDKVSLRGNDLRVDLRGKRLQRVGQSTGGFGLAFDDYGRMFGTHNLVHLRQLVFPGTYLANKAGLEYGTLQNVSDHEENGTSRLFPIGEQATRVNHPEESGYFSGACGLTSYSGGAFGPAFEGNIFVNDVVVNVVHRDILQPEGTSFRASRDRERAEFLASQDRAFRPVNAVVGPEGALYILDMHRAVIEHPEWIPDEIEAGMDLRAGMEQGRIFRITPKSGLPPAEHRLDRSDISSLTAALEHPMRWWRSTAQRLLVETGTPKTAEAVRGVLMNSASPLGRLHALWTLQGMGELTNDDLLAGLQDRAPGVRENAAIIAEDHLDSGPVADALRELSMDSDARVRLRATLALATAKDLPEGPGLVQSIAAKGLGDTWQRRALLALSEPDAARVMLNLLSTETLHATEGTPEFLAELGALAGRRSDEATAHAVLEKIAELGQTPAIQSASLAGFAAGLETRPVDVGAWTSKESLAEVISPLFASADLGLVRSVWRVANLAALPPTARQEELLEMAKVKVRDTSLEASKRLEQLSLLELTPFGERESLLFELVSSRHPREVQEAAVRQLTAESSAEVADKLVAEWKTLPPPVRTQAGNMLLRRREHHLRLLSALETGQITLGEMDFNLERRRMLLWWSDNDEVKRRAEKLFSDAGVVTRQAALEQVKPALEMAGDAARGHQVYLDTCAKCHIVGAEGVNVGPTLTDIFRKSKETLLHDIIDPNAAVNAEFISFSLETQAEDAFEQQLLTGMIVSESDDSVTLREAGAIEHAIPRSQIKSMTSTGLSMMPEALEAGLSLQQLADLLAFLQTPR